ncbi:unnamed protein product [Rotaria sordida]|uniref:Plastocyanin-like domain-containing protein n=1 Tax=Rotaria sordida TaxID=392033 RepID=A0A814A7X8_9BILA|nr:unnamed protein product [Rotaria sordida]CAF3747905.1 unnamed protein product [Rotaria sordida]
MTALQGPYSAYRGSIPMYPWSPTSFLINGHGKFDCRTLNCSEKRTWQDSCGVTHPIQCLPLRSPFFGPYNPNAHSIDEFLCLHGKQIRLRLINAVSGIPFRFWIGQHNLIIVARDSIEIVPITVSFVHITIEQRLDLTIDCNQDPIATYTIFAASRNSYRPLENTTGQTSAIWTWALLVYSKFQVNKRTGRLTEVLRLSPDNSFFEYEFLKSFKPRFAPAAVRRVTLAFETVWNNHTAIDALEEWVVNEITFESPKEPLLHANFFDGTFKHVVANERPGRVNNIHATYVEHFEYGQTYEILMINYDPQLHPWHLHEYSVDFIAASKIPTLKSNKCNGTRQDLKQFDYNTILPLLNSTPRVLSIGDSFNIPRESYVLFRFTANNPGPWTFYCHMQWRIEPGVSLVFSVE